MRVGAESAVLVLGTGRDRAREAAGILGRELLSALGMQVLWLPVGGVAGLVAHLALGVGVGAVAPAVAAASVLEVVVTGVLSGWTDLTRPGRLEFAPPDVPVRVRAVRSGLPGRWRSVAELGTVRVAHRITEPVAGDPRTAPDVPDVPDVPDLPGRARGLGAPTDAAPTDAGPGDAGPEGGR